MKKLLDIHCKYKILDSKAERKKENQSWAIVTWHKPIAPHVTP